MINIAILGYGYWGPNLVRNFNKFSDCNISYIVDTNINKLNEAKKFYPNLQCVPNPLIAIKDKTVDAVVIALPVSQHYKYAKLALENNKYILMEKPATDSYKKLKKLTDIAKKRKLQLMVDYTFLYTPAVQKIKELLDNGVIGDILFVEAQRLNLGIFRNDVDVVWDLAVHDISIIQYILNKIPKTVSVKGLSYIDSKKTDLAYITLKYDKKQVGHISSSWLFPFKNKRMVIGGSKKTIVYDDIEPTEKIKVYDKGYNIHFSENDREKILVDYRVGDIFVPKLSQEEALYKVCSEFLTSVKSKKQSLTGTDFALKISKILDACSKSIAYKGKEIKL
ncbi:MAG: Gfo/Idh/MocA family oxidoreductase [Endomicrobiaceae bacterium]|nr:Gfo/Idh/MocA family oxidoreductase [Endomicrobiaceae bacterium]